MADRASASPAKPDILCDFCGVSQHEAKKIIRLGGVFRSGRAIDGPICSECAALCVMALSVADRSRFEEEVAAAKDAFERAAKPQDPS
jgi:hypothetical protein